MAGVASEVLEGALIAGGGDVVASGAAGEFGDAQPGVALGDGAGDAGAVGGEEVVEGEGVAEVEAEGGVAEHEVEIADGGGIGERDAAGGQALKAGADLG